MWIGDDDVRGRYGDAGHAEFIQGGGEQGRGEALAHAGYGVERARRQFPQQGGALQEAFQFGENLGETLIDLRDSAGFANQRFQGFPVLFSKIGDQLRREFGFTGFDVMSGINQSIGYAAHRGHHDHHGAFRRGGLDDGGGAGNARGIADRGTAKLHDAQRSHYGRLARGAAANTFHLTTKARRSGPLRLIVIPYSSFYIPLSVPLKALALRFLFNDLESMPR